MATSVDFPLDLPSPLSVTVTLSAGPYGGMTCEFTPGVPGSTRDLPSPTPGYIERYQLRSMANEMTPSVAGDYFGLFIGTFAT